ncbi:class I SAM-dependent methyltransferase [Variovorax robiniae]|uniref:Class I SAM-dependent methyltransferase n=1 Tax=Variovorax robiniae TaxID=1836199 RepID=A0ABU8X320_9BURK
MTQFLWQDRDQREYAYVFNPRPECLALIQREPTVALDIGCGSGAVGQALRQRFPHCALWGCEFDPTAAELARQHFDQVVEHDVETVDFNALGLRKPFDLICLFDVLEHLVNPWQLLHGLLRIVAPDAQVLVSLPNASNLPMLYDALRGHWHYRRWGLLDFTHLRFFTDFDARKMFYQAGYRVLDHRVTYLGEGGAIFQRHRGERFPLSLIVGELSIKVQSVDDLSRLCADQNLYLITPHHGELLDDTERAMASAAYPHTFAFGGD